MPVDLVSVPTGATCLLPFSIMVAPTLPLELIQHVCYYLCSSDLLSMRAASQAFASIATPGAFCSVSFRVVPELTDHRIALVDGALSHIIGYIRVIRIIISQRRGKCRLPF
jgi:hypothetical protein